MHVQHLQEEYNFQISSQVVSVNDNWTTKTTAQNCNFYLLGVLLEFTAFVYSEKIVCCTHIYAQRKSDVKPVYIWHCSICIRSAKNRDFQTGSRRLFQRKVFTQLHTRNQNMLRAHRSCVCLRAREHSQNHEINGQQWAAVVQCKRYFVVALNLDNRLAVKNQINN